MKKWILVGSGVAVVLIGAFLVANRVSPLGWGLWGTYNTSSGIALNGYDPVAYFKGNQPMQGDSHFTHEWGGATWMFSSADNRDLFSDSPESYAPQFGGFCAFAVSKGFTADISPDAWHIKDKKLYVFADQKVQKEWVTGIAEGSLDSSNSKWNER